MLNWGRLSKAVTQGKEELRGAVSWLWAELRLVQISREHALAWMGLMDKHSDSEQPLRVRPFLIYPEGCSNQGREQRCQKALGSPPTSPFFWCLFRRPPSSPVSCSGEIPDKSLPCTMAQLIISFHCLCLTLPASNPLSYPKPEVWGPKYSSEAKPQRH